MERTPPTSQRESRSGSPRPLATHESSIGADHGEFARVILKTIVTEDLDASAAFYGDLMGGYREIDRGSVESPPAVSGAGRAGRRFVLLQFGDEDRAFLRLLEAPNGATPNRPRGIARGWDSGFMGQ